MGPLPSERRAGAPGASRALGGGRIGHGVPGATHVQARCGARGQSRGGVSPAERCPRGSRKRATAGRGAVRIHVRGQNSVSIGSAHSPAVLGWCRNDLQPGGTAVKRGVNISFTPQPMHRGARFCKAVGCDLSAPSFLQSFSDVVRANRCVRRPGLDRAQSYHFITYPRDLPNENFSTVRLLRQGLSEIDAAGLGRSRAEFSRSQLRGLERLERSLDA